MKRKKLTAIMLVTAITASLLAGCGGGSDTGSTGGADSAGTSGGGVKRKTPILREAKIRKLRNFPTLLRCRARR